MLNILGNIASVPAHWFRIAYAQNALTRSLDLPLASLGVSQGVAAMLAFQRDYRPQHAELDELDCSWGPQEGGFRFAIERRMHRHDHDAATLTLAFDFGLTPSREALSGTAPIASGRDATRTAGYRAVARAAVLGRSITLRGGEPLSS